MAASLETPVSPKVTAALLAAAVTTILVYLVKAIWGVELDVVVQGAITTILVGAASWYKSDGLRNAGQAAVEAPAGKPVGEIPAVEEEAERQKLG